VIFNRFAREARRCVEAAVEKARLIGHDSVGDEDLLLGILHADEGMTAEALTSLGVTLRGAREESERMASDALASVGIPLEEIRTQAGDAFEMRIPDSRRVPFSPQAKKVLERSLREGVMLGDRYLGAEHILLGILHSEDGMAVRMLSRIGVSPEVLEDRLFELRGRAAG
jgi:ATP-dependent Clp protease ATP-binding subunit ClpC